MTPRLEGKFGRKGLLIGGVIWALWHTPLIYMGLNYPDAPLLGHALWIPICICLGIIFQWSYRLGCSILAPAFVHGVLNKTGGTWHDFTFQSDNLNTLIHGSTGVIGVIVLVPIAWLIYAKYPNS